MATESEPTRRPPLVRQLSGPGDAAAGRWRTLRDDLYGTTDEADSRSEAAQILSDGRTRGLPYAVFIAHPADEPDEVIGFIEVSLRRFAEGCRSDPVGFIEGWMVVEAARGTGVGRLLINRAEDWARERGCTEIASDAELENEASAAAHRAMGFREIAIVRCFAKEL